MIQPNFTGSIGLSLAKGPLEAILGVVYGVVMGVVLWYFPTKGSVSIFKHTIHVLYIKKSKSILILLKKTETLLNLHTMVVQEFFKKIIWFS